MKDSRLAVHLTSAQDALIRHAAEVEGQNVTEFVVASAYAHARDVLADRRVFALDGPAHTQFMALFDRPVQRKPRLAKLLAEESIFTDTNSR